MLIGLNNSKPTLNFFKKEIEKKIGKIEKAKFNGSDNIYNHYSFLVGRYLYSAIIPKRSENSNSRSNFRYARITKIRFLNKAERQKF